MVQFHTHIACMLDPAILARDQACRNLCDSTTRGDVIHPELAHKREETAARSKEQSQGRSISASILQNGLYDTSL